MSQNHIWLRADLIADNCCEPKYELNWIQFVQFNSDLYNSEESSGPLLKQDSLSSTANIEDSDAPILTIKQQCLCFHNPMIQGEHWSALRNMQRQPSSVFGFLLVQTSVQISAKWTMDSHQPLTTGSITKRAPQKHTSDTPSIKLKIKFPAHPMYREDVQHKCKF